VKEGEIDKKRSNIGFLGRGYRFDEDEENEVKKMRQELSKSFGFSMEEDEEDPELKKEESNTDNEK